MPKSQVLGEVHKASSGERLARRDAASGGRHLASAAPSARLATRSMGGGPRRSSASRFGKFQGVSFKLADMATELKAAELLTLEAAWKFDAKTVTDMDRAMAKLKRPKRWP